MYLIFIKKLPTLVFNFPTYLKIISSSKKCTLGPSNQLSRNISQEEALGSIFELNAEK